MGERFAPILGDIASAATGALQTFRDDFLPVWDALSPSTQRLITAMGIAAGIFAPVAIAVGTLMTVLAPVIGALGTLTGGTAVGGLLGFLSAAFSLLLSPIGLVTAAIVLVLSKTEAGQRLFGALGRFLKEVFVATLNLVRIGWDAIVSALTIAWGMDWGRHGQAR